MRNSWAQPSLSRDFALLAAAILFILFLVSAWVTFITYTRNSDRIAGEMEEEAVRIERALANEMQTASYLLHALGRQIVLDQRRGALVPLAQMLKSFDSREHIYSGFSWVTPDWKVVVSSNRGVLEKPVDVADRDYAQRSLAEPWKMQIGNPVEGRISNRWVIPTSLGITDYTGKFIGTLILSIDINALNQRIGNLVQRHGLSFSITSKELAPLTHVSDHRNLSGSFVRRLAGIDFSEAPGGMLAQGSVFLGSGSYIYYRALAEYPYVILIGYDAHYSNELVRHQLWSRLMQLFGIGIFFVLFLWVVRVRMIHPIMEMSEAAAAVAKGEKFVSLPQGGAVELEGLSTQIQRIGDYIAEMKRIEDELRNKTFMLKKSKERAEMNRRSKSEFLNYICQEMRQPLTNILGFAQVMKDQLYGPIENRKYRQYAIDMHAASDKLLDTLQNLSTLSAAETDYIELFEKPADVAQVIRKGLETLGEKLEARKLATKIKLPSPLPHLLADEFRLQQIFTNLLLHAIERAAPEATLLIEVKVTGENRDKWFFALVISTDEKHAPSQEKLIELAERATMDPYAATMLSRQVELLPEQSDIGLELAKALSRLHNATLHVGPTPEGATLIAVFFPASRIRFVDEDKQEE